MSDFNKQNDKLIGKVVRATVVSVDYNYANLKDDDGNVIRVFNYEIGTGDIEQDVRDLLNDGQVHNVFVASCSGYANRYYGSIALAEEDPWNKPSLPLQTDSIVTGTVVSLSARNAFINLRGGIKGIIRVEDLTQDSSIRMGELLEIGDTVKGRVKKIDRVEFRVEVSIDNFNSHIQAMELGIRNEWNRTLGNSAIITRDKTSEDRKPSEIPPYRILVVEDRTDILNAIAKVLVALNASVDKAHDFLSAYKLIRENDYDFFFVDYNLQYDNNGADLIRDARDIKKLAKKGVYLLTGAQIDGMSLDVMRGNGVDDLLYKPVSGIVFRDILAGKYVPSCINAGIPDEKSMVDRTSWMHGPDFSLLQFDPDRENKVLLRAIHDSMSFDSMGLFKYSGIGQNVELYYGEGLELKKFKEKPEALLFSPIRDIVGRKTPVILTRNDSSRFARLYEYIPGLTSIIGYPVMVQGKVQDAIVFFRAGGEDFTHDDFEKGSHISWKFSKYFEQYELKKLFEKEINFSILGRLILGLSHELRNRMQSLDSEVCGFDTNWRRLLNNGSLLSDKRFVGEVSKNIANVTSYQRNLNDLVELFLHPVTGSANQQISLKDTIDRCVKLLSPDATSQNVRINVNRDDEVPDKIFYPALAMGQILTNLVLNAIQQKDKEHGLVNLGISYEPEAELPIVIDVSDNSRGIHRSLYEKIFDPLFTTKKHGIGMGLYISRNLALANGSTLELKESYIYTGSTFRLRIPLLIGGNE